MSTFSKNLPLVALAAALYAAFAVYLYRPHFPTFSTWHWLLPANAAVAAVGCFVLSRRWVMGFLGSLLAGAVYGFGPYLLALGRFHPIAGFLAATIPWLFLPAAFLNRQRRASVKILFSILPFAMVILFFLFFRLDAEHRLFAAPIQTTLEPADLVAFIAPLVLFSRTVVLPSLYHVALGPLILGMGMMLKARRFGILLIIAAGFALTFCRSYLGPGPVAWVGVSPILWLSIPLVCLSVLAGVGLQGLIEAGASDREWVLATGISLGILAGVTLMLAAKYFQVILGLADGYARLFVQAAKMYLLGAVAMLIVFLMARQQMRLRPLRWVILAAALGLDIFLGARYIVDKIF